MNFQRNKNPFLCNVRPNNPEINSNLLHFNRFSTRKVFLFDQNSWATLSLVVMRVSLIRNHKTDEIA